MFQSKIKLREIILHLITSLKYEYNKYFQIKTAKTEKSGAVDHQRRFLKPLPSYTYVNPLHSYNLKMILNGNQVCA